MTDIEKPATADRPAVRARRIRFAYPDGSPDRHFVDGDLVMSHVIAQLSATFPEGEDFFVRHYATTPLRRPNHRSRTEGAGPGLHRAGSHPRPRAPRAERPTAPDGLPHPVHRPAHPGGLFERVLSPLTCLAITAALEHFTAVFAEILLTDERAQALLGSTEVRSMRSCSANRASWSITCTDGRRRGRLRAGHTDARPPNSPPPRRPGVHADPRGWGPALPSGRGVRRQRGAAQIIAGNGVVRYRLLPPSAVTPPKWR